MRLQVKANKSPLISGHWKSISFIYIQIEDNCFLAKQDVLIDIKQKKYH